MIWLLAQPAKQKQLKVIVSVFWWMGDGLPRPGAHQRFADTWLTANAGTQWPLLADSVEKAFFG
jgi:hypothetical protein